MIELEHKEKHYAQRFQDYMECALSNVSNQPIAQAWIESDDESPESFLATCAVLGFDPDYIRKLYRREKWKREAHRAEHRQKFTLIRGGKK